jgi:hypothetical protein
MKEATGELNMTVVTVVAIAAVAAFFYAFVWPAIKNSIKQNTYCADAVCGECTEANGKRTCTNCTYTDEDGTQKNDLKCTFKETASTTNQNG